MFIRDAGGFDVIVQTLIEAMMTRDVVLLTARPSNFSTAAIRLQV
jgi:hypothetical protein